MPKNLQITITAEGATGRVDIIGSISEWGRNNATDFRSRCEELKKGGVTSCHVYLMTVGGDCFQANEIVNILNEVFGSYTGEGGAMVASAGTYIAVHAKSFLMAKNGQFMIHKPQGSAYGNEVEIKNQLTLIQNMTKIYYDAYKAKLKKPESEFETKWNAGDFWMTAEEAKSWGFVSAIKEPVKINDAVAQLIRACGSPIPVITDNQLHIETMDLQATATALGLAPTATQEEINAKIAECANKVKELETLQAQIAQEKKQQQTALIKAALDAAEKEHRIVATERAKWQAMFDKDFDGTKALLDGIQPVKKLSAGTGARGGQTPATGDGTHQGKTFDQWQEEDPNVLATLQEEDPDAYDALFEGWKKKNGIK
ncbi:ATP-dependent Clp protease proteolytic subunit [termite gut metagenome]|uniref:ATP-dependent Clp protease proteolytic subunit n=1 Tax=termite gut metagenome TaxID=433724 RepID=A0A5J4SLZ4_9ZZZZ